MKKGSKKVFTVIISEDGSSQIIFGDGKSGEKLPSGTRVFADRRQMIESLGKQAERIPEEPGTYLVYLDVWEKHMPAVDDPELREAALGGPDTTSRVAEYKFCRFCGTRNNSKALYCRKCAIQLH